MTSAMSPSPNTSEDLSQVRDWLGTLIDDGRKEEQLDIVVKLLEDARRENNALEVRVKQLLRSLYGTRSERVSEAQLRLALEELALVRAPEAEGDATGDAADQKGDVERPAAKPRSPRGRGGRKPLPENLPREEHVVPVPANERTCDECGGEKQTIGHIESEVLEFVPAHFKVIVEKREKLACLTCKDGVVAADSQKVMDRGRPGPGLLADIITGKFQDSLPLYRQAQRYERAGVSISRSTLGDWSAFGIDVLEPVAFAIAQRVVADPYVQSDDTRLPVLSADHPGATKRGRLWVYVGMTANLVAFDYTENWKAEGMVQFLRGFRGFLQTDGYAGFAQLTEPRPGATGPPVELLGCGMHIRRKFEAAYQAKDLRGAIALDFFKALYRVERAAKVDGSIPDKRDELRREQSLPVVDKFYDWARELHPTLVPGTLLHKATQYALNHEVVFRNCFTDGRFEIDNGEVERQIRRVALGRKNYLFAGNDRAAKRIATAYTVLGSCHMNGAEPVAYMTDVISKLQSGWPESRLRELLPDRWRPDAHADDAANPAARDAAAAAE